MKLIVEHSQRYAKMRAHTATHLLHAELSKIFPVTKQAGSLVDEDYLRFDFNADRLLSSEELHDIEKNINQIIYDACDVDVKETAYDDAIKLGAKAFFEDKYGDRVRVVRISDHANATVSIELCGGTHVANTKDIGCFAIIGQEAVASGVKRISAVVGPKVGLKIHELQETLDMTIAKLGIKTYTQLSDKLEKTLKEYDDMKSALESVEAMTIKTILTGNDFSSRKDLDRVFLIPSSINFKNILPYTKGLFQDLSVLIYNADGNFLLLPKIGINAKDVAHKLGLKGGGNEAMVQGRDEKVLGLFK